MDIFILFIVFIFGLVVGSFLNVIIFRLNSGEEIVNSRSKCLFCGHQLAWHDLFPVFSFIFLRGKCHYCKKKISLQYPLVEISTAMMFVLLFDYTFHSADDLSFLNFASYSALIYIFSALIVIFIYDLRHYIIPDKVIYPAIAAGFILIILDFFQGGRDLSYVANPLIAAVLAAGFFLFLIIITKGRGMGGGDVKLGFLMGLMLGFPNILLALFVSFVSGAATGILLMLLKKKGMKSMLPFGPFLVFGSLAAYFYGSAIMGWYWKMVSG